MVTILTKNEEKATTRMLWLLRKLYHHWVVSREIQMHWFLKEAERLGETRCNKSWDRFEKYDSLSQRYVKQESGKRKDHRLKKYKSKILISEVPTLWNLRTGPMKRLKDSSDVPEARLGILPKNMQALRERHSYILMHMEGFVYSIRLKDTDDTQFPWRQRLLLMLHNCQHICMPRLALIGNLASFVPLSPCSTVSSFPPFVLYVWCVVVATAIFMDRCSCRQEIRRPHSQWRFAEPLSTNEQKGAIHETSCGIQIFGPNALPDDVYLNKHQYLRIPICDDAAPLSHQRWHLGPFQACLSAIVLLLCLMLFSLGMHVESSPIYRHVS